MWSFLSTNITGGLDLHWNSNRLQTMLGVHHSECIKYSQTDIIQTSPHLKLITDRCTKLRDRTLTSRGYAYDFPMRSGWSNYFVNLSTYVLFVEQPVVSLPLYNGAILWLLEAGWEGIAISNRPYLNMYVRYLWSPVHISHGFAFKLHILHKSDNIPHWVIVYRCTKPDSVQFMRNWEKYATSFEAGLSWAMGN